MKHTKLLGTASALLLAAAPFLGGCTLRAPAVSSAATASTAPPAVSLPPQLTSPSSDATSSPTTMASSDNTSATTPATTSAVVIPGALTKDQAIEITKALKDRVSIMNTILTYPTFPSAVEIDQNQTIPGEPDFWLVTDKRFQSLAELRTYAETVYTPAYVDKYLSDCFEDGNADEDTYYKEYEGRLYANSRLGGRGSIATTMWDTLRILSQDEDSLTVAVDLDIDNKYVQIEVYYMEKSGEVWRLDDLISIN